MTDTYNPTAITKFYDDLVTHHGDTVSSVGWANEMGQKTRFVVLSMLMDLSHKRVLDVGCGLGDMAPFLMTKFPGCEVVGVDISESMVEQAKAKYPGYEFRCLDILDSGFDERFDVVLSSGAMSIRQMDHMAYTRRMISKMWSLAEEALGFTVLSARADADITESVFYYYEPMEMFELCREFTPWVSLNHHYLKHDMAMYMYRG